MYFLSSLYIYIKFNNQYLIFINTEQYQKSRSINVSNHFSLIRGVAITIYSTFIYNIFQINLLKNHHKDSLNCKQNASPLFNE